MDKTPLSKPGHDSTKKLFDIGKLIAYEDNTCLIQRLLDVPESVYTYGQIVGEVKSILNICRQQNVVEGSGIALHIEQHTPASCVLLLTTLNWNCFFYALASPPSTTESIKQLSDNGINYLITTEKSTELEYLTNFQIYSKEFYLHKLDNIGGSIKCQLPLNMCYTIATTGSTGSPKIVHVPYDCIAPNVKALSEFLKITASDVIYLCAPPTFDPFVIEFFLAMYNGAALLITTAEIRLAPDKLLQTLLPNEESMSACTVLQMTPSLFRCFGAGNIRQRILCANSRLRVLLLGGEPFPNVAELKRWTTAEVLKSKFICNIYGVTELSCWSTIYVCRNFENVPLGDTIERDTQLRILNDSNEIAVGAGNGALFVGSAERRCYIPAIDGDKPTDQDVLFRDTGDLVTRLENGQIYFQCRTNDVVKRAGKRLCLSTLTQKIEDILERQINTHCLWISAKQKLVCVLHMTVDSDDREQRLQKSTIMTQLAPHEQPDKFIYQSTLPLNKHGKLNKKALLSLCEKQLESLIPAEIFKSFLSDTLSLELSLTPSAEESPYEPVAKCAKMSLNITFRQAGGSSFHALSLTTEIGSQLEKAEDQSKLLTYLLDDGVTIRQILDFLTQAKLKKTQDTNQTIVMSANSFIKFSFAWRVDFKKCIDAGVANFNDLYLAVGAHSRLLQVLNPHNGQLISSLTLPDRIECKVCWINAELALVGCYDGHLYAFQPQTGAIIWSLSMGGLIKAQPLMCGAELVIVASYAEDFNVSCISLTTHNFLWRSRVGSKGIFAAPVVVDEHSALVCSLDGSYARIDIANGHICWQQKCDSPIFSTPCLLPNCKQFVLAEVKGSVHICKLSDGVCIQTYKADGNIFSSFTLYALNESKLLLLFGCHDQHVYCLSYVLSSNELSLLWRKQLNAAIYATPVLLPLRKCTYVLCCTTRGLLALVKLDTGEVFATHTNEGEIFSTPCCIGNHIYFGCRDNYCYCYNVRVEKSVNPVENNL